MTCIYRGRCTLAVEPHLKFDQCIGRRIRGSHGDRQHECSKQSSFGRRSRNVSGGLDDRRSDGEYLANLALIALAVMLGFGNYEQRRREQNEGQNQRGNTCAHVIHRGPSRCSQRVPSHTLRTCRTGQCSGYQFLLGTAFAGGVLSGVVEPIGTVLTILASQPIIAALLYLLGFAAGAMLYVVVEELVPETSQGPHSILGTAFFAIGFSVIYPTM